MKIKIFKISIILLIIANYTFAQEEGLNVGNKAPNFTQKLINGENFTLSSLKGKMVLIDFWASWCGPCRRANPGVVEVYKKYKDAKFKNANGFTVVSVSLDNNKKNWAEAVKKDNLIWEYHISDLKGWMNAVAMIYQIRSVPTTYLIDGNGIIIGKKLHGDELDKLLKKNKKGWF